MDPSEEQKLKPHENANLLSASFTSSQRVSIGGTHSHVSTSTTDESEAKRQAGDYESQGLIRKYFLELVLFLYSLGTMLHLVPLISFMGKKACINDYHLNETYCEVFETGDEMIKNSILADTQFYGLLREAVSNIPGAIAALVAGRYLTRYGFRAPLMLTMFGSILTCLFQLYFVVQISTPLYWNVLAELPGSITGGTILMLTAAYTYVTVKVPKSRHMFRITMVSVFQGVSILVAMFLGGALATAIGIAALEIVCAIILVIPTLMVIFFFEDIDVPAANREDSWREAIWVSLKEGLKNGVTSVTKPRADRRREQISSLLVSFICAWVGLSLSYNDFAFNYARSVLNMNQTDFGALTGISLSANFILVIPGIVIVQKLKISHPIVIAVGSAFFVLKFAFLTLSEFSTIFYYIQLIIGFPFFISLVSMRVYITELLDLEDVPVFMALLASIEKLVPLASGALASAAFYLTRDTFPGFAYLIVTLIYVIPVLLGVYCEIILLWNKRDQYEEL